MTESLIIARSGDDIVVTRLRDPQPLATFLSDLATRLPQLGMCWIELERRQDGTSRVSLMLPGPGGQPQERSRFYILPASDTTSSPERLHLPSGDLAALLATSTTHNE